MHKTLSRYLLPGTAMRQLPKTKAFSLLSPSPIIIVRLAEFPSLPQSLPSQIMIFFPLTLTLGKTFTVFQHFHCFCSYFFHYIHLPFFPTFPEEIPFLFRCNSKVYNFSPSRILQALSFGKEKISFLLDI